MDGTPSLATVELWSSDSLVIFSVELVRWTPLFFDQSKRALVQESGDDNGDGEGGGSGGSGSGYRVGDRINGACTLT